MENSKPQSNPNVFRYLNTLLIVIPMTLFTSTASLLLHGNFGQAWLRRFLYGWLTLIPIAYVAAVLIIPIATQVSQWLLRQRKR